MSQYHETPSQELSHKLEESVTAVTLLNTLFVAMPPSVHPFYHVQMSAITQALAEIAHRPHRQEAMQRLTQLTTELATVSAQLYKVDPVQQEEAPAVKAAAVEEPVCDQEQNEALRILFPNNHKE